MLVRLKNKWFGPTKIRRLNKIMSTSGRRYKPGDHEMPSEYEEYLPSSATVLSGGKDQVKAVPKVEVEAEEVDEVDELVAADADRAAAEAEANVRNAAAAAEFQAVLDKEKADEEAAEALAEEELHSRADEEAKVSRDTKPRTRAKK